MSSAVSFCWHDYKYYPYERQLAIREVGALLGSTPSQIGESVEWIGNLDTEAADRLVYFSQYRDQHNTYVTKQARLEQAVTAGRKRQATRYSVHGIHEYNGKFNPQVAKAILNILRMDRDSRILDPFCGSGTTLVEASQLGAEACGFDLNPLAVYIANAKLVSLGTPAADLADTLAKLRSQWVETRQWSYGVEDCGSIGYLQNWFDQDILKIVEKVRLDILKEPETHAQILLVIASNLLRDYSQQDPKDLRIRRRTDALPDVPFWQAVINRAEEFIEKLRSSQPILGADLPIGRAIRLDVTCAEASEREPLFDAAITSPPYAMALPYVDTQRLSLVWLRLLDPKELLPLEAALIGSRETRGSARRDWEASLGQNGANLPARQYRFCQSLSASLAPSDGFRRRAMPALLYRYFATMRRSFEAVASRLAPNAPYALIVGHNHTVLGGKRHDIDTPRHLVELAEGVGWHLEELIELQTYQRYGYHQTNAVRAETLILLRNR